jgi:hypothetical protein
VIEPQQAEDMLSISLDRRTELQTMAQREITAIASLQPDSPEMSQKIDELADLGDVPPGGVARGRGEVLRVGL